PLSGQWLPAGNEFVMLAIPAPKTAEDLSLFSFNDFPDENIFIDLLVSREEADSSLKEAASALNVLKRVNKENKEARQETEANAMDLAIAISQYLTAFAKVEKGDLSTRVNIDSKEEIFVTLSEYINHALNTLEKNKNEMEGIIEKKTAELKIVYKQITESSKLAAVGRLAGGVAHEINNPLSVILGFAQSVAKRIQKDDPLNMPLKSIEREAVRCKRIVQDLLIFSRSQGKEPEFMDIISAIESAESLILSRAKTINIKVEKGTEANLPQIFASPTQIQQVIINIANNALDAMEEKGGTLTIRARSMREEDKNWVEVQIEDTGGGIPKEAQDHVFEPFFTTKDVGKGTGLGLGISYDIIQKAGGTITFTSEEGKGTCFTVRLSSISKEPGADKNEK
ncbi:MAG: ATP-binding protein, partial [Planctomycetota bacterium]